MVEGKVTAMFHPSLIFLVQSEAYLMEQRTLQNLNNCLNTNIYSYLDTSWSQSSSLHLNVVHFFNTSVNETSVAA
jgi:hypothetical protein